MNRQFPVDIISMVRNPSHYLGSEVNAVRKDPQQVRLRMALAFPDRYEVGMSHLGIQILYHILNARKEVWAERVFAPAMDMEEELRARGIPLCSLETGTPLAAFSVIGFSLLYELNFTNLLNMLDLAGVPFYSRDRGEADPLVIAGGPCTFNPEPVADFFDAMVIGDGEDVVLRMVDAWLAWREGAETREALLKRWAGLQGVYVPAFFEPRWDERGCQYLTPLMAGYDKVRKATAPDLNRLPYPEAPIVAFGSPIHDRLSLEICRGCTRGCRFCQAGMIYRPVRERAPETILSLAQRSLVRTGYEDLSLLSLSTGDYGALEGLMARLVAQCEPERIALSLPSLRVGSLTESLMAMIKRIRKTGFTLAPEAGSPRLRDVINKNISETALMENVERAFSLGWRLIKLYFMIGLPTEREEDLEAIVSLVGRLKKIRIPGGGRRDITVSVSTFVPKAHTPFQWMSQASLSESRQKIEMLRDRLRGPGLRFKWQNPEMSLLEGLWARGDRRLGPLLVRAFALGCRFDGWSDQFRFETWREAMALVGVDLQTYRAGRSFTDPLPWDHIDAGVTREFLLSEWQKALAGETTEDCRDGVCQGCGVCDLETVSPVVFEGEGLQGPGPQIGNGSTQPVFKKLRVTYMKMGPARFFGHLEMVKILTRAFRRARIPLRYSEGFHPAPKMSFSPPLPVGVQSREEVFRVEVPAHVRPAELVRGVNEQLPEGLRFTGCVPSLGPKQGDDRLVHDFWVQLAEGAFSRAKGDAFRVGTSWSVQRKNKKGNAVEVDLKKVVTELEILDPQTLRMRLDFSAGRHVRPSEVLATVFGLPDRAVRSAVVIKEPVHDNLTDRTGDKKARPDTSCL